jgi:hypothetical protein
VPVDLTVPLMLTVGAAAFLLGVSKAGLGGGLGPLVTVMVSIFVPPARAIGVLLPLLIVGDVFAVWTHRRSWDRALLLRLLPAAVLGVAVASFFLGQMSERGLQIFLAVLSVVFVVYRLAEPRIRSFDFRPGAGWGVAAGFTSGVTSTIAHSGGPPVVVYLLASRTPPITYVATTAVFFGIVNWLKVPGYIAAGLVDVTLLTRLAPFALLTFPGALAGRFLVERVSKAVFDRIVIGLLIVGAVYLLVS